MLEGIVVSLVVLTAVVYLLRTLLKRPGACSSCETACEVRKVCRKSKQKASQTQDGP